MEGKEGRGETDARKQKAAEASTILRHPCSMQHSLGSVTLHSSRIDAFARTGSPITHVTNHGSWFYTCKRQTTMHTARNTCHITAAGHLIWAYCSRLLSPLLCHGVVTALSRLCSLTRSENRKLRKKQLPSPRARRTELYWLDRPWTNVAGKRK